MRLKILSTSGTGPIQPQLSDEQVSKITYFEYRTNWRNLPDGLVVSRLYNHCLLDIDYPWHLDTSLAHDWLRIHRRFRTHFVRHILIFFNILIIKSRRKKFFFTWLHHLEFDLYCLEFGLNHLVFGLNHFGFGERPCCRMVDQKKSGKWGFKHRRIDRWVLSG